jgi:hypothetical protein
MGEHLTRYSIRQDGRIFRLEDRKGRQLSWHRTQSGALRARQLRLEEDNCWLDRGEAR